MSRTIDWDAQEREAVSWLQQMIRFDTTNPPGNELALVRHLAAAVEREGLSPRVLVSGEERANLVIRLAGDGSERPLLLMSHLDVVPAEPDQWTHPPFAADRAGGFVWGRGAVDCKLTAAVSLQVLLLCHRLGLPLKRDLVVVGTADEELGATYGLRWLTENHPEIFDAEYGINEGGGFALMVDGRPLYTCQVGEKGGAGLDLVAHGRPGHSSVPHGDNAIFHLAEALRMLGLQKMPHRVVPSVRAFFEEAAAAQQRPEVAQGLRDALDPERSEAALAGLPVNEPTRLMFDSMLRNTCPPTILEAGVKRNVIPSTATAQLSARPLPGVDRETFMQEVRAMLGDPSEERLELRVDGYASGVEVPHETPLFEALRAATLSCDPDAVVLPYMVTGGTDARWLQDFDIKVYGFTPMRYEAGLDFFDLAHGHDERVSVQNLRFATQVIFDAVCRLNEID